MAKHEHEYGLYGLLLARATDAPTAPAIAAPGRLTLDYAGLLGQVEDMIRALRSHGIQLSERVAVALPQGPECLTACLGVAAGAIAVPLNPNAATTTYERVFDEVTPVALVTLSGLECLARTVALARGIRVLDIQVRPDLPAGRFELLGSNEAGACADLGGRDNVALLLGTSGTTSRPKFVPLRHRHVLAAAGNTRTALALGSDDRCLDLAMLFHAHGLVAGAVSSLVGGGCVICPPEFDSEEVFSWIDECRPTWITAVPTVHQAILRVSPGYLGVVSSLQLRLIRSASAYLPDATRDELERIFRTIVVEGYGLTEAMQLTNTPLEPSRRKIGSMGLPGTSEVGIMAPDGHLLEAGVQGEIVARGPVVIDSYWYRPDADAEAFRDGWFRTGDVGYLDDEGHLFMTGRLKDQINRGGEKIAPQEVDAALLSHPAVAQAMAFGIPHPTLGEEVAAAVVLRSGQQASPESLRRHASGRLADYQVPQQVFIVPELPASSIGKLLRRDLAQRLDLQSLRPPYEAPRNDAERRLVSAWESLLGVTPVGIRDNFFALGGDSLLAARMAARIGRELGLEVPLALVFSHASIAELSSALETGARVQRPPVRAVPRDGPLRLSFAQQRLWVLERMDPGSTAYSMPEAYRLVGRLDAHALQSAVAELVARHESLRTRFTERDGEPVQLISPTLEVPVAEVDLSALEPAAREEAVRRYMAADMATPFNLEQGPLLRFVLLRLGDAEAVLLLNMHHIVSDGWSKVVISQELGQLYAAFTGGASSPLTPLPIQYADYAAWQRELLDGPELGRQLGWWRQYMAGAPDLLELPSDRPRPAEMSERGARFEFELPDALSGRLVELARKEGVTLFQLLLTAFHVLLARYSRQDDIVTGSPVAGRGQPEFEPLVGFFVNTLLTRSRVATDEPFRALLARVRADTLAALEHQDLPFERLVEVLQPPRSRAWSPLFQVMFILQNNPTRSLELAGLEVTPLMTPSATARFDLTLSIESHDGRLGGFITYRTDLFDPDTIERMAGHFRQLLAGVVADPESAIGILPLLTRREAVAMAAANPEYGPATPECVHHLFERHAEANPRAMALRCEDEVLTYEELEAHANRVAQRLVTLGVAPDVPVGLFLERGIDMVVGLLGILKAGGAYLALDPALPTERLRHMLADASARAVVTHSALEATLPNTGAPRLCLDRSSEFEGLPTVAPAVAVRPGHLAYIIYTSGSTGLPKGVGIEHRQLYNYVTGLAKRLGLAPGASYATVSTLAADLGNTAVFPALMLGGCLHVITQQRSLDGEALADYFGHHPVDLLKITPSHLAALQAVSDPVRLMPRRWLVVGGEASSLQWVDQVLALGASCRFFNHYGPTETTVGVLTFEATPRRPDTPSGTLVLGRPLPNSQVFVVDNHLRRVPLGVPGELLIGGAGVARGYLGRPELNAEKFIVNPFGEGRLYRSGDLVRQRADGNIEFLGRIDDQVKIRGFRVELGEVESALRQIPSVKSCAVLAMQGGSAEKRLVAYVVGEGLDAEALRGALGRRLPEFMVPAAFVMLERLPLTPNGKLDRRALPVPEASDQSAGIVYTPPETELERRLVSLWERLLGRDRIGIDDDFFDLGGHSLLAIRLFGTMSRELGATLPERWRQRDAGRSPLQPALLWTAPTIRRLAAALTEDRPVERPREMMMMLQEGDGRTPFIMLTGDWGGQGFYVRTLARHLDPGQPVWALAPHDLTLPGAPDSIEAMADDFLERIRELQPRGPYQLGGYSQAGLVGFEIARRLEAMGEQVGLLFVIDTTMPDPRLGYLKGWLRLVGRLRGWERARLEKSFVVWCFRVEHARSLWRQGVGPMVRYYLRRMFRSVPSEPPAPSEGDVRRLVDAAPAIDRMTEEYLRVIDQYVPGGHTRAPVVMVSTIEGPSARHGDEALGWRSVAPRLRVMRVPGGHATCLTDHIDVVASHLRTVLPTGPAK